MSIVGQGFGAFSPNKTVNMLPKNPQDVVTIVSVFPREIKDNKITTFPKLLPVPAAPDEGFSLLHVHSTSWFKEQQEGPTLEIYVSSKQTAEALIKDYCNGLLEYTPGVAAPGIFFCYGKWTKENIKEYKDPENPRITFETLLKEAHMRQREWWKRLIDMSDKDWAITGGNPLAIAADAKIAAEKLGFKDKPWMANTIAITERVNCKACGSLMNPAYPVCAICRAVNDPKKAEALGLKFVV